MDFDTRAALYEINAAELAEALRKRGVDLRNILILDAYRAKRRQALHGQSQEHGKGQA
ncbi:hypothetical protein [Paracoccus sp. (in: a-proteobacteria)]|uniref:hypothetical protein n=1 Tax=Paracoccus sp. TaxID=267 RepID=UPI0028999DCE|nr:hypothetical protein [Paracoccus sp. (in: a-proteobacteria)]